MPCDAALQLLHLPHLPHLPRQPLRAPAGLLAAWALTVALAWLPVAARAAAPLDSSPLPTLPAGFKAEVWASGMPGARSLGLGDKGTVFVGTSGSPGKVYAVATDKAGQRHVKTIASGLPLPNGVAFHQGALYVASTKSITRYDRIEAQLDNPPRPALVDDKLPGDTWHGLRVIAVGPDNKLYLAIGAPCNVCEPDDAHGLIRRMNLDGSGDEVVARGVRNSVGFDWDPATGDFWFSNNGRDRMGDDVPNDTLHRVARGAPLPQHAGFPYCHQGNVPDPEFGPGKRCADYAAPAALMGAHVATLGLRFYAGAMFPDKYRGAIFVARHGSWNRSSKVGADVVAAWPDGKGGVSKVEPFLGGLIQNESYLGRPVDVLVLKDGSLLVSDDLGGIIWRISYGAA